MHPVGFAPNRARLHTEAPWRGKGLYCVQMLFRQKNRNHHTTINKYIYPYICLELAMMHLSHTLCAWLCGVAYTCMRRCVCKDFLGSFLSLLKLGAWTGSNALWPHLHVYVWWWMLQTPPAPHLLLLLLLLKPTYPWIPKYGGNRI